MFKVYVIEKKNLDTGEIILLGEMGYVSGEEADHVEGIQLNYLDGYEYSYKTCAVQIKYAHRNGESEAPTEYGWYFVEWNSHWTIALNPTQNKNNLPLEKYYGPVPLPTVNILKK